MDCIVHRVTKSWTRLSDFHLVIQINPEEENPLNLRAVCNDIHIKLNSSEQMKIQAVSVFFFLTNSSIR